MSNEQIKDGGPAYPMALNETTSSCSPCGMSLRDWFAGMALQGLLAQARESDFYIASFEKAKDTAVFKAYSLADAMIVEREKKK